MRFAVVSATVVLLLSAVPVGQQAPTLPSRNLEASLTLLTDDGTISACEPLIALLHWKNVGTGKGGVIADEYNTGLEVRGEDGSVLAATPTPPVLVDGFVSVHPIKPGETYAQPLIVSRFYQFTTPGRYTVHVKGLDDRDPNEARWELSAPVEVLPLDPQRLEHRCEELFGPVRRGEAKGSGLSGAARHAALYSVSHDVALPYLDWFARGGYGREAVWAIQRVGTERSARLLEELGRRKDQRGEEARRALAEPLPEPGMDDVIVE